MTETLHFDGSTECRGRNGWFKLAGGDLILGWYGAELRTPRVWLSLWSKRSYGVPPILVDFHHPDELKTLICGLSKAYAQMLTTPEETPHVANR